MLKSNEALRMGEIWAHLLAAGKEGKREGGGREQEMRRKTEMESQRQREAENRGISGAISQRR